MTAPTDLSTRPAALHDAGGICEVIRRSITECCSEDHHNDPQLLNAWLRNKTAAAVEAWLQSPGAHCVVAERGDRLVGFGLSRGEALLMCYVLPELLFTGVGKALLQALEVHAAAQGISVFRVDSTRTARAFYSRNGFDVTGPAVQCFGLEAWPMAKSLRST